MSGSGQTTTMSIRFPARILQRLQQHFVDYGEQAFLDDNGTWQYGGASGCGSGTFSASASVYNPTGWLAGDGGLVASGSASYTENYSLLADGQWQASPVSSSTTGTFPGGVYATAPSAPTSGSDTGSLVALSQAAVNGVWGMGFTADAAQSAGSATSYGEYSVGYSPTAAPRALRLGQHGRFGGGLHFGEDARGGRRSAPTTWPRSSP